MSSTANPAHETAGDVPPVNLAKFGMLTFLASEAMLFAGLISAYLILWISRGSAYRPDWIHESWPIKLTGGNTILLLASSYTLWRGEKAVAQGKPSGLWIGLTTLLGAIFVTVQGFEWTNLKNHENLWFNTAGTYSANFFLLTGFHGLHVSIGVIFLAFTTLYALAGKFTPHRHSFLTCVSLYWHFVDVVWILLFFVMYVLPFFIHPAMVPETSAVP